MEKAWNKIIKGYQRFRQHYADGDQSIMHQLATHGQKPDIMVVACSDSRVDPSLILQCDPGDLFVVRNVANIVPPYEADQGHHGTSAALEFGICYLKVKHLVILGHSQCGGIQALMNEESLAQQNDFISRWVSLIKPNTQTPSTDACAQSALHCSYTHCLSFPWIQSRVAQKTLMIHRWFFDIQSGQIHVYSPEEKKYSPLRVNP